MRKYTVAFLALFSATSFLAAQNAVIKGRIVDSYSSDVIPDVIISIQSTAYQTTTNKEGLFTMESMEFPKGRHVLVIRKEGYNLQRIPIIIQNDKTLNLDPILLEIDVSEIEAQIGVISLSDNDLSNDDGTSSNVSGLLQASRDAFLSAAAFDFSATFFRPRGQDNANGKVLINGLEMNKQDTGRPQWGNWGGLNDVQRNREFSMGLAANDYTFGDVAGTTNMVMRASKFRKGGRVSYASSNRSYRGRIMGTYNSGLMKNGWAFSFSMARRYGDEGFQEGTLYDANSFFISVEKKINKKQSLNFTAFYTPNSRGRSGPITQEQRYLKGVQYNPNWGFQDGEIRNSRIREIEEPVFMLNHYWTINEKTTLNTNLGYQTGTIKNSRIDNNGTRLLSSVDGQNFYSGGARNIAGNYYQRLPSYHLRFSNPTAYNFQLAHEAREEFVADGQIPWEIIYDANIDINENPRNSTYILQNDVTKDHQFQANAILFSQLSDNISLNANLAYRNLSNESYAEVRDLLGGSGYLDIDTFSQDASGDGSTNTADNSFVQSDVRNPNRIVGVGNRYKYNFEMETTTISGFAQAQFKYALVDFYVAANVGSTQYQRNGLYENGNFQGGNRSFGESEQLNFTNYGVKGGATYKVTGRHLVDLNAGYLTKAPSIRNSFSNSRQSNETVIDIEEEKVANIDLSYIYRSPIVKKSFLCI